MITSKEKDELAKCWDTEDSSGLRYQPGGVANVEYFRDIQPILKRSCAACHSATGGKQPAGHLNLDADHEQIGIPNQGKWPGSYYRLAADSRAKFGHKPVIHNGTWRQTNASRYIRKFQSRRSLLVWKIHGQRLDGWTNNDFPTAHVPGDPDTLRFNGQPIPNTQRNRDRSDLDFRGKTMPPPEAVKAGKVQALSDEDRRTIVRWIDLGCPIDFDYDRANPNERGFGWMCDDKRPTLTLSEPARGENRSLSRILIGMDDYYSGLDVESFSVIADFDLDGVSAGENLAPRFKRLSDGVFELKVKQAVKPMATNRITVSVSDRQGNISKIERIFSVKQ